MQNHDAVQVSAWGASIDEFLRGRLDAKLEKLREDELEKREALKQEYRRDAWLKDAASRVGQIRLVTHAVKYAHPDARGSSVYMPPSEALPEPLIGSAGQALADDVVGNAAALDVFKFLKLDLDGVPLLKRAQSQDAALLAAFSSDEQQAQDWCRAFAGITQDQGAVASHTLAKQLYFQLPDGSYHLLAPLYPTALAHDVHLRIQSDRFSDEMKAARDAWRARKPHLHGFREYPNIATRGFGGSKPQNISQLNSERRGVGYLLAACPPVWQQQAPTPPTRVSSIFSVWLRRSRPLRELTKGLKDYLERLPPERTNIHIRDARGRFVAAIVDAVMQIAESVRQLPPGWSAADDCRLGAVEAYWLDPDRALSDETFAQQARMTDWPAEIGHRFGNWLNGSIRSDKLKMGDAEHAEWKKLLDEELTWLKKELRHD